MRRLIRVTAGFALASSLVIGGGTAVQANHTPVSVPAAAQASAASSLAVTTKAPMLPGGCKSTKAWTRKRDFAGTMHADNGSAELQVWFCTQKSRTNSKVGPSYVLIQSEGAYIEFRSSYVHNRGAGSDKTPVNLLHDAKILFRHGSVISAGSGWGWPHMGLDAWYKTYLVPAKCGMDPKWGDPTCDVLLKASVKNADGSMSTWRLQTFWMGKGFTPSI